MELTAKEYLEKDSPVWKDVSDSNIKKAVLVEFAEEYAKYYHEAKVKNLGLLDNNFSKVSEAEMDRISARIAKEK